MIYQKDALLGADNASRDHWQRPCYKICHLVWDIFHPGETDNEKTTVMSFLQVGYIEMQKQ